MLPESRHIMEQVHRFDVVDLTLSLNEYVVSESLTAQRERNGGARMIPGQKIAINSMVSDWNPSDCVIF